MPMAVVGQLEVIEVEKQDRAVTVLAARRADLGDGALLEAAPVQAPGERVGTRHLRERLSQPLVILSLPGAHDNRAREHR